jgi:heme oxygenase
MGLREATAELHSKAEKMEFNQRMFRGELSKEEYVKYLSQQYIIFSTIESVLPDLLHVDLVRTRKVQDDIKELQQEVNSPIVYLESAREYSTYLYSLNHEALYSHIYLNYLALAYGGQMMKKNVPGSGRMYDFENMHEAVGAIRAVQKDEWADEVNKGFQFIINIADELQNNTRRDS